MIVSDAHRLLFVHVQKTGGVTLTNLLLEQLDDVRSVGPRHAPLGRILEFEPGLVDYWTFGFVRNPWARMVSWWSMIENWRRWAEAREVEAEGQWNDFWRSVWGYGSFEEFVLRGTEEWPRLRKPQVTFLTTSGRRADFIGRAENLAADAGVVLDHFGLDGRSLGHHNSSKHADHRDYYNAETRDAIGRVYARDVDEFGYDF